MKKYIWTVLVLMCIMLVVGLFGLLPTYPRGEVLSQGSSSPSPTPRLFTTPAQLEPYFTQLDISKSDLSKIDITLNGPDSCRDFAIACFMAGGETPRMNVRSSALSGPQNTLRTALAHEYMHYVWYYKIDDSTRQNVSTRVREFYNQNPIMKTRMKNYLAANLDAATFNNELQAIECTEISDWRLPKDLLSYCSTYLPNRSVMQSLY